jgi:cytochrome c oxidase subunit IV
MQRGMNYLSNFKKEIEHKNDFKRHTVSFIMMILLTGLAFIAVESEAIPKEFTILFITILALIQVFFQFYIWMHASQKGHGFSRFSLGVGFAFALPVVAGVAILI